MIKQFRRLGAILLSLVWGAAYAVVPAGGFTLAQPSPDVRDYFFRVDVDPGESYPQSGTAPSSVFFAQYLTFQNGAGGFLGLQRVNGVKRAIVSIWHDNNAANKPYFQATSGAIPALAECYDEGACTSLQGPYVWKVGHQYRFRVERSPVNPTGWWRIILTDLTTSRADVLGEIRTPPSWNGLAQQHALHLDNFEGPYQCDTLRYSQATYMPPQGNFGQTTAISAANGSSYQNESTLPCAPELLTSDMTRNDIDSRSYLDDKGNVVGVGNAYRGLHAWPNSSGNSVSGLMYSIDADSPTPSLYRALKTGVPGPSDVQFIGMGLPLINDLYHQKVRLYEWDERDSATAIIGRIFVYRNPDNGDIEYFRKAAQNPGAFPTNKTNGNGWTYLGRHAIKGEALKAETHSVWGTNDRYGQTGELFESGNMVFRLKTISKYGAFPTTASDNAWWQFVDYVR